MENKRGVQLSEAFGAILAVVLIAVLVIVGLVLFETLSSTGIEQSRTVTNETGAYINETGYTLSGSGACGFASPTITLATNATNGDGTVITAANYTVSSAGVLTNITAVTWADVNVSYTYTDRGETCNASEDIITQFATYPALVGLVGTIIFLGLVIGILVASFVFGDRRRV